MANSVFWLFKKEILRINNVKTILPIVRFCFEFTGDSGNYGEVVFYDEYGVEHTEGAQYNYKQTITVSASSIKSFSSNFREVTC